MNLDLHFSFRRFSYAIFAGCLLWSLLPTVARGQTAEDTRQKVESSLVKDSASIAKMLEALPEQLPVKPGKHVRILLLTKGTYGMPGASALVALLREADRRYDALEVTELFADNDINAEMLKNYDLVVLNAVGSTNRREVFNEILPAYVREGGAIFATHSSLIKHAGGAESVFNHMMGAVVDDRHSHTGHPGKHWFPLPLVLPDPTHPAVRSVPAPVELGDEPYVFIEPPDQEHRPQVLIAIDKERVTKQEYPDYADALTYAIAWTKPYGKGRTYYTQWAHFMKTYTVPWVVRTMLDGLLFTAGALAEPENQ